MGRRAPRLRRVSGDAAGDIANWVPFDIGDWGDLEAAIAIAIALLLIVFVVIPLFVFGIELILVGVAVAASIIGRLLLGRPWIVAAERGDKGETVLWEVSGWRR